MHLETGRWKDTPLEHRRCCICNSGSLENEQHFLLDCDALKDVRTTYFIELHDKVGVVPAKTENELIKQLLHKDALRISGRHLEIMYMRRRELMYKC